MYSWQALLTLICINWQDRASNGPHTILAVIRLEIAVRLVAPFNIDAHPRSGLRCCKSRLK